MDAGSTFHSIWVKAAPFVPDSPVFPQGSSALQPENAYTLEDGDVNEHQDDLGSQLKSERELHAVTKYLLQCERDKVHKVQAELEESKRQTSSLVASHRLNAEVLNKAVSGIELKIDKLVKKADLLTTARGVSYHDVSHGDGNSEELPDGPAHGFETSHLHVPVPQLPVANVTDERPSILYDVLARGKKTKDLDGVPDLKSSNKKHTKEASDSEGARGQANQAEDEEQKLIHPLIERPGHQLRQEEDRWLGLDQVETLGPTLGEFHSSDEGLKSESSPKPLNGSQPSRLSEKGNSEDKLINILPVTDWSPMSKVVNGYSAKTGISEPEQLQSSVEESNIPASKSGVIENTRRTAAEPVLGVEQRTTSSHAVQTDNKIWKDSAGQLASLPTLHLPASFLVNTGDYRPYTASSESTISTGLDGIQSSQLALARMPPLPTHPQAEALKNAKTFEESDSSTYIVRHGSIRSRVDDHTALASDMRLNSATFDNAEATGAHENRLSSDDDAASLPNIRPSSGVGDNYNVIPVSMTNYLEPIDWKMSRDRNPVFRSEIEKETIQRGGDQLGVRHSAFWVHPVRYEPVIEEPNVLRTVQIDHIPRDVEVLDVLMELCWGTVESIQLVDIGNFRGPQGRMPAPYKFARIVFSKARQASQFQRYAHNKPLTMSGQQVRVYVQMEPTYPRTAEIDEAISDKGMTRILSVIGLTDSGRYLLPAYLKSKGLDLVSLKEREHDEGPNQANESDRFKSKTLMEFRSVLHAFRALRVMENGGYEEGAFRFIVEPDYCARLA